MDTIEETTRPKRRRVARLLDLDPELADGLRGGRRVAAAESLLVGTASVGRGSWAPPADALGAAGGLGLLVTEGVLVRAAGVGARRSAELIGPGDLLRPWIATALSWSPAVEWRVLAPLNMAILDARAATRIARFPEVFTTLAGRGVERSQRLATLAAISRFVRVEDRLLHLLWGLAERWGHVTPGGVVVELNLTHELLGLLVGARRPTITTSLGQLVKAGHVEHLRTGGWLLHGSAPGTAQLPG